MKSYYFATKATGHDVGEEPARDDRVELDHFVWPSIGEIEPYVYLSTENLVGDGHTVKLKPKQARKLSKALAKAARRAAKA